LKPSQDKQELKVDKLRQKLRKEEQELEILKLKKEEQELEIPKEQKMLR
jgi:hypothetical protein